MEIKGKIKVLNLDQKVSEKYTKSEIVIVTDEQYPQSILIEFGGQKSDLPHPYKVGESVTVSINIKGREWVSPQGEVKYFNSIHGWKITKDAQQATPAPAPQAPTNNDEQDVPF